jgi:DNA-nicking Smr family endonuclease
MAERKGRRGEARDRSDSLAWWWATKGVDPMPGRARPDPPIPDDPPPPARAAPVKPAKGKAPAAVAPAARAAYAPALHPGRAPGLDRRSQQRLSRGLFPIAAELDLHGMRRHEAHDALQAFLAAQQGAERRCVRVITGRGRTGGEESGILRDLVPRWLNEVPNRQRVLSFDVTQPRHGGAGALYVLLRRRG